jgi:hypothetical protein
MDAGLQSLGLDANAEGGAPIRIVSPPAPTSLVVSRVVALVCVAGLGIYCLSLVSVARTPLGAGMAYLFGLFFLSFLPLSAWAFYSRRRQPNEVTGDSVRLYVGLSRRERVIPLEAIAAVGMVFIRHSKSPSGWFSFLWTEEGESVSLGLDVCLRKSTDDWETLATTPQGSLCIQVLDRARTRQGPSGPIARDSKTDRGIGWRSAYWPANRSLAEAKAAMAGLDSAAKSTGEPSSEVIPSTGAADHL